MDLEALRRRVEKLEQSSPLWPTAMFLVAEAELGNGQNRRAAASYRKLATWAAKDPYGDGWGGSTLGVVALWRWLEILAHVQAPQPEETAQAVALTEELLHRRFARSLFAFPLLTSLPKLETAIYRRLASLTFRSGRRDEEALGLFLNYLVFSSPEHLTPQDREIEALVLETGLASRDRLRLLRARRLWSLGYKETAGAIFGDLVTASDNHDRAEALFYVGQLRAYEGGAGWRAKALEAMDGALASAKDPDLLQAILYERALIRNREGANRDSEGFVADLERLLGDFPQGKLADEALYELARHYQLSGELTEAERLFRKVRQFPGPNDRLNLAHIQPAMTLILSGGPEELERAYALLEQLDERLPAGPYHLGSLFWRGRIAEELGWDEQAGTHFTVVIKESPFDYYAIRARLHQSLGAKAAERLWLDPASREAIHDQYHSGAAHGSLSGDSPYHLRLRQALGSGDYRRLTLILRQVRQRFPTRRPERIPLYELDQEHLLTPLVLLLSLRQDLFAAKDTLLGPFNRLELAKAIGSIAGDWPVAMAAVMGVGERLAYRAATAQQNDQFLATAYPPVYHAELTQISEYPKLPPALLYAVVRNESLFDPTCLSSDGALGLFQFSPWLFSALDDKWNLLASVGVKTREHYLLDPERSLRLGARWFGEDLLATWNGELFPAILEHQAGRPAVEAWQRQWVSWGKQADLEYKVETIRYLETRLFARNVLRDMAIVDAIGLLGRD